MIPWINMGAWPQWLDVRKVEETHGKSSGGLVRFIGSLCLKIKNDEWSEQPVEVFWQENRVKEEHSHYFGLYQWNAGLIIADAASVAEGVWQGLMHPETGEVIFSRFRHDFRSTMDGRFSVDGGRDYTRILADTHDARQVSISIDGPHLHVQTIPDPSHGPSLDPVDESSLTHTQDVTSS